MTIEGKLRAVEKALTRARENSLDIVATQEFGAVKREVRAFFTDNKTLADLFPTRVFGSDDHLATPALVGALDRARDRIEVLAKVAAQQVAAADGLLKRARALEGARGKKAELKQQAIELLKTDRYKVAIWDEKISAFHRWIREAHVPSADLCAALAAAKALNHASDADKIDVLIGALDSLAARRKLKHEINEFLEGSTSSHQDLRPRRLLRVDHAPIATLIDLLEAVRKDYAGIADPATKKSKLETLENLRSRLERRRDLKAELDECLKRAKAIKAELRIDQVRQKKMVERITEELEAQAQKTAKLREQVATASAGRWTAQRSLENAERACELVRIAAEALDDEERALPRSREELATRRAQLEGQLASAAGPLATAEKAEDDARRDYEEALARALASKSGSLPDRQPLQEAQKQLFDRKKTETIDRLELGILRSASADGDVTDALGVAVKSKAAALKGEVLAAEQEIADRTLALSDADQKLEAAQTELRTHELKMQSAVEMRTFCLKQLGAIDDTLARYDALKAEYRNADALACYVRTAAELGERLQEVALLVRGRRAAVDSMGSVRFAFLIDAGVRAGVELGFLELTAEVRVTLLLEGSLGVLDSREVMFQGHLGVFLSAAATARLGVEKAAEDLLGAGDILPVPDLLLKASATCKASLYDVRSCSVYDDADHWAGRWAHEIARRQTFVRKATLTSGKIAELNDEFFRTELDKLVARNTVRLTDTKTGRVTEKTAVLGALLSLDRALKKEPREFSIETAKRFEGRATASAGEHSKTIGSDAAASAWTVEEVKGGRSRVLGELVEHTFDFVPKKVERDEKAPASAANAPAAPASFVGTVVFHSLSATSARPPRFDLPRAFLEVTMIGPHKIAWGELTIESAGTSAKALGGTDAAMSQRYRGLSQTLDANPSGDFESFDRVIRLPPPLEQELKKLPARAPIASRPAATVPADKWLARTARLRLDMVIGLGQPTKLTQLLNEARDLEDTIDKRLATASEKAGQARKASEKLSATVNAQGSVAGGVARKALPTDLLAPTADLARLVEVDTEYLRTEILQSRRAELEECVTLLRNSHAAYARYVRSFRCLAPPKETSLSWEPTWVAQAHRGLSRRRFKVSAEASVTVAPFVKAFLGTQVELESLGAEFEVLGLHTFSYLKSLHARLSAEQWASWWQLHKGEIFDICESVATPGSVPFSEVVLDGLHGRDALKNEAKAFGAACWRAFREDENPFEAKAHFEAAVVKALQGDLGPGGATAAAAARPITRVPVLAPVLPKPSRDELAWLTMSYLVPIQQRLLASFSEDDGSPRKNFATLIESTLRSLARVEHLKQGLVTKYDGPFAGDRRADKETAARRSLTNVLESFRGAESENARRVAELRKHSFKVSDRVAMARDLARLLEERFTTFSQVDGMLVGHLEGITPVSFEADGDGAATYVADGVAWVAALLRAPTLVPPLAQWKQQSAVSFMLRSGATDRLDKAVEVFHRSSHVPAAFPPATLPRTLADALALLAFPAIDELQAQLRRAETLRESVQEWHKGRDEGTSRRAPSVAAVLEVPLEAELRRSWLGLALLLLRVEMGSRLEEMTNLRQGIAAAEDRKAVAAQRTFRYRQDVKNADLLQKWALKGQRAFRARKEKREQGPPPLEALKQHLLAYLKAAAPDFSTDPLMHGRKKTLLRGERFPVFEVEEPTTKPAD